MGREWISRTPPEGIHIEKHMFMNIFSFIFFFCSSLGKIRLLWNEVEVQFPFSHACTINNKSFIYLFFFNKSFVRWHTCAFSLGDWLSSPSLKAIPVEEIPWAERHGFLVNARGQYEQHWSWSDLWLGCGWTVWATHLVLDPGASFVGTLLPLQFWKFVWFPLTSYWDYLWS